MSGLSFGIECNDGGDFYACSTSIFQFVGCCTSSGCGKSQYPGCPTEDLRKMSYNITWHEQFENQVCQNGSSYFSCAYTEPYSFTGCCADPDFKCSRSGCTNVTAASLSGTDFLNGGPEFNSSINGLGTPTPTPEPTSSGDDGGLSTGAIAGIAVGVSVVGLLAIAAIVWFCWRRRRAAKTAAQPPPAYTEPPQNQYPNNTGVWPGHSPDPSKAPFSPMSPQDPTRYSTMSGSTYYGPGSPPQEQQGFAKYSHPTTPHMSQISESPAVGSYPGAGWDARSPGPAGNDNTIHELPPASQAAPAELADSTNPATSAK